jgi:hypothetical protein
MRRRLTPSSARGGRFIAAVAVIATGAIGLVILPTVVAPGATATAPVKSPDNPGNAGLVPICHRVGGTEVDLNLPIRAAIDHLLPSLTDPTTDHLDSIGRCSETSPPPRATFDFQGVKVPLCHRAGGTEVQLTLSIRGALEHVIPGLIDPNGNHVDAIEPCPRTLVPTPPPSEPPPPPSG